MSHGIEVYAHKVMLSSSSSYFLKIFTESGLQENRISLEEISGEALRSTVEYIYFEKELVIHEDNVLVNIDGFKSLNLLGLRVRNIGTISNHLFVIIPPGTKNHLFNI